MSDIFNEVFFRPFFNDYEEEEGEEEKIVISDDENEDNLSDNMNNQIKIKDLDELERDDKVKVLEILEYDHLGIMYVSDRLKSDKVVALKSVENFGLALQYLSEEMRDDRGVVILAVRNRGIALQYASERLRDDENVVLEAVENDGVAIRFASERLKKKRDIVEKAVRNDIAAMDYVKEKFISDVDIANDAFEDEDDEESEESDSSDEDSDEDDSKEKKKKKVQEYAEKINDFIGLREQILKLMNSEESENHRTILLDGIEKNPQIFEECVDEELRKDEDFLVECIKRNYQVCTYMPKVFLNSRDFVMRVVKTENIGNTCVGILGFANQKFKCDKEIVLAAVRMNRDIVSPRQKYGFVSRKLLHDGKFFGRMVTAKERVLEFVTDDMRTDRKFILDSVQVTNKIFKYCDEKLKRDRGFILELLEVNSGVFSLLEDEYKTDREFILEAVKRNGNILEFLNRKFQNDYEIVLASVQNDSTGLQFANKELKKNRKFVLESIKCSQGSVLRYTSEELRNDREVVLEAMKYSAGEIFEYVDERLRNDREVVIAAMDYAYQNGGFIKLEHVGEKLKNDDEVVFASLRGFGGNLESADEKYQKNKEFVIEAIRNVDQTSSLFLLLLMNTEIMKDTQVVYKLIEKFGVLFLEKTMIHGYHTSVPDRIIRILDIISDFEKRRRREETEYLFSRIIDPNWEIISNEDIMTKVTEMCVDATVFADKALLRNAKFASKMVRINGVALQYYSVGIKNNLEVIKIAVENNGLSLEFAEEQNEEIVNIAVEQNGLSLKFVSKRFICEDLMIKAVKSNGLALQFADEELRDNAYYVVEAVKQNGKALKYAGPSRKNDKYLARIALKQNGNNLKYCSKSIKNNEELVKIAVEENGRALKYADKSYRDNELIVYLSVKTCGESLKLASDRLRNVWKIVHAAVSNNWKATKWIGDRLKRTEFCVKEIVRLMENDGFCGKSPRIPEFILPYVRDGNIEIVKECVNCDYQIFKEVREELRGNISFVRDIVIANGLCLQFCSDELIRDEEILKVALKNNGNALFFVRRFNPSRKEVKLALECCKSFDSTEFLRKLPFKFRNDEEIVVEVVKRNGIGLRYASLRLKGMRSIVIEAVMSNGMSLEYVTRKFREDLDIVRFAILQNGRALQFASKHIRGDIEIVKLAIQNDGDSLRFATNSLLKDENFCTHILEMSEKNLKYMHPLFKYNREFLLQEIGKNPKIFLYISSMFKNDRKFVEEAIDLNGDVIMYVEKFKGDKRLMARSVYSLKNQLLLGIVETANNNASIFFESLLIESGLEERLDMKFVKRIIELVKNKNAFQEFSRNETLTTITVGKKDSSSKDEKLPLTSPSVSQVIIEKEKEGEKEKKKENEVWEDTFFEFNSVVEEDNKNNISDKYSKGNIQFSIYDENIEDNTRGAEEEIEGEDDVCENGEINFVTVGRNSRRKKKNLRRPRIWSINENKDVIHNEIENTNMMLSGESDNFLNIEEKSEPPKKKNEDNDIFYF